MAKSANRPDNFMIIDPFQRPLRFFMDKGKYYRRDESIIPMATDQPDTKEVSKVVYALQWLELCLSEMV